MAFTESYKETFKLAERLIKQIETYGKKKGVSSSYYNARNTLINLQDRSEVYKETEEKFNQYLKNGSTLELKELVNTDTLEGFNTMAYIDNIMALTNCLKKEITLT